MPTAPSAYTQPDLYRFAEALLTYATTLAFYLHLRASDKYAQRPDLLSSHPVFGRLLSLKQALHTLEELDFAASDAGSELSSDFDLDDSELDSLSGGDGEEEEGAEGGQPGVEDEGHGVEDDRMTAAKTELRVSPGKARKRMAKGIL